MGDVVVLVSAWVLGPVYGSAAAGIGSMLADLIPAIPCLLRHLDHQRTGGPDRSYFILRLEVQGQWWPHFGQDYQWHSRLECLWFWVILFMRRSF